MDERLDDLLERVEELELVIEKLTAHMGVTVKTKRDITTANRQEILPPAAGSEL